MSFSVKFDNNTQKILQENEYKARQILTAIGLKAVSIWTKEITNKKVVDTGRFRSSVTHEVNYADKSVSIGSNVDYAPYLELGSHKMKARPTLKPTIMNYKDAYKKIAEQIWKQ